MNRALASYFGALVVIAWAILTAWHHLRRGAPDREPEGDVQPWDPWTVALTGGPGVTVRLEDRMYTSASGGSLDWRN